MMVSKLFTITENGDITRMLVAGEPDNSAERMFQWLVDNRPKAVISIRQMSSVESRDLIRTRLEAELNRVESIAEAFWSDTDQYKLLA